jgi:diacylglycerol kinase (ATP)
VGIGIDGAVAHIVEKRPAKRFGVLSYLLIGTWLGLGYPAYRATLQMDEREIKANALQIVIGNTQLYAGAVKYTSQAKCDDGLLDVCIVRKRSVLGRIIVFISFLLHDKRRYQWVSYDTGTAITMHTRQPVAIQIDGDAMGYTQGDTPTTISVAPAALKVVVPQHLPSGLFSDQAQQKE